MVGFHVRKLWDREESAHTSTKSKGWVPDKIMHEIALTPKSPHPSSSSKVICCYHILYVNDVSYETLLQTMCEQGRGEIMGPTSVSDCAKMGSETCFTLKIYCSLCIEGQGVTQIVLS